ncbi:MAG: hypothetical protein ACOCY9_01465 [Desulfohalobiaceae bacterium]
MEILWISLLILIFAVLDALVYTKLKSRAKSRVNLLNSQEEELYRQHQDLAAKVQELKEQEQKLRLKKNLLEQSWRKKETNSSEEAQESMEEMVLRKELATPEQIQKAKRYIQNNHLPMSVLDALIMLDVLDLETAKALKQNLK